MKYKNIIPAVPGSMIIWYNHCHDSTQSEPLMFWGAYTEGGDPEPYVVPYTLSIDGGQATPFQLPEMEYADSDPRHGKRSSIIAIDIPGWGRLVASKIDQVYGAFTNQVRGYDENLAAFAPFRMKADDLPSL